MNRIAKLSTAVALGLSLMSASLAADAASARPALNASQAEVGGAHLAHGKVIKLGTIVVTPADAEGAKPAKAKPNYGSVALLGRIHVTLADSPDVRAAAEASRRNGVVFLGSISVTPADSTDARYAVSVAKQPGVVFIGSVQVKARNGKLPVIGNILAAIDSTRTRNLLAVVGALVFARAGG